MTDNTINQYLKYLEDFKHFAVSIKTFSGKDVKPKPIEEWYKEDYADRVELYWMLEYDGKTFPEEIWKDGYEDDPQLEADCEVLHGRIWDLIENGYNSGQSVSSVAKQIWQILRKN